MKLVLHRLFNNEETFYGQNPSYIAQSIENRLNELLAQGLTVINAVAIPDFHNWSSDGGVKDVIFFCHDTRDIRQKWRAIQTSNDNETFHGTQMNEIMSHLQAAIAKFEDFRESAQIVIAVTDYHDSATTNGVGGLDGLKTFILCF